MHDELEQALLRGAAEMPSGSRVSWEGRTVERDSADPVMPWSDLETHHRYTDLDVDAMLRGTGQIIRLGDGS